MRASSGHVHTPGRVAAALSSSLCCCRLHVQLLFALPMLIFVLFIHSVSLFGVIRLLRASFRVYC